MAPWYEVADFYKKTVELYRRQFGVLQLIVLVMVVLGVANSVNTTLYERTGEVRHHAGARQSRPRHLPARHDRKRDPWLGWDRLGGTLGIGLLGHLGHWHSYAAPPNSEMATPHSSA